MKIKVRQALLLPTAQYANMSIEVSGEVDTELPGDLAALGLSGDASSEAVSEALRTFVDAELFATKEVAEGRPQKDFKLTLK